MQASLSWSACLSSCPKAPLTSPAQTQQTITKLKKTRALSFIDWARLFEGIVLLATTRRQTLGMAWRNPGNRLLAPTDSTKINLLCKQQNQVVVQFAFSVGRASARAGSSVASLHQTVPLPKITLPPVEHLTLWPRSQGYSISFSGSFSPSKAVSGACNRRGVISTGKAGSISCSVPVVSKSRNLRALTRTRDSSEPAA